MLSITIPDQELFSNKTNTFEVLTGGVLRLEHSLISISKWESKWKKAFITKDAKTTDEIIDYIRCMTLNKGFDDNAYQYLTVDNINAVYDYIHDPMTATVIYVDNPKKINNDVITAELLYYYMTALNIPFECEKWHLNRLIMLIRVCDIKTSPPEKLNKKHALQKQHELNAARRKQYNSKG